MSRSIDERIVEMKFNNKDFERNAAETMSTLEKLKAKLKFDGATKGIEEIERAGRKFNLDGMGDATDVVVKKFDIMATAAFTVINRIVDKAMDAGEKLVKSLSLDQVTAGWEKYNSKVASVQTIVNATGLSTETVERYLSKLMWYSDETSYSFSEMVSALGQMTSAGGDINKLIPMIMGIANAAAYAGKIGEPFVHAIRNLNQSYSMGYLNLQDWKSVELAGVNSKALMETLIKYGKEFGTITADMGEITAENFRNSLKDKWATKEVMEAAFGEFASMTEAAYKMVQSGEVDTASEAYSKLAGQYGEIAERAALAAQEAKTFEEAIDATKDAVSTKWLNIFDTIIGSYDEAKRLWTDFANDLWDVFAGPMDDKQATLDQGLTSGFTRFVREKQLNTELLVEEVLKQIDKSDREAIEKAATGDYGIIDTLEGVGNRAGKIRQTIADYGLGEAFKDGALSVELLTTSVHNVRVELDNMVQEWTTSGYDIDQEVKDYHDGFVALDDAIVSGEIDGEQLKEILVDINRESGRANLVDALKSGWQALFRAREDEEGNIIGATGLITVFKKALADLFPPATSEQIYAFTERIKNFAESLILTKDQAKGLRNIIRGFLQPLRWAADGIKTIWGWMKSIFDWGNGKLRKAFEWFSDVENIGDFIHKIFGDERYVRLTAAWNTISEKLGNAWKTISDALGRIFGKDKETSKFVSLWQKIKDAMGAVAGWILDRIVDLVELIASINFEQIADDLASYFETAWAWLKTSYANVKAYIEGLHLDQVAANVWKWIVEAYGSVKNFIENFTLDGLIQKFKDAWEAIKNFFSGKNPDGSGQLSAEKSWLAQQLDALKTGWEKIAPTIQPILEYVSGIFDQFVKHITPGNVAIILFGYSVIRMVKAITAAATGVASIGGAFNRIASGLQSLFKGMGARLRPNYIRELSIAIGMMTAAISVFFMLMKDPTRLREASILLGTIATVFVGLVGALAAISKAMIGGDKEDKTMSRLSGLMLTFSASLILLAASVSIISGINLEDIWARLGVFAITLIGFIGSIVALSKFVPQVSKGMHGLLFMAGGIYTLVLVVQKLTTVPINDILNAIPKFLILIGMLALLAKVVTGTGSRFFNHIKGAGTTYSSSRSGPSIGAAAGMFVMVLDLLLLSSVLKKLAKEPVDDYINGLFAFIPLFAVIGLLSIAMRVAGKHALGVGVGMIAIMGAMLLLGVAIKYIGSIDEGAVKRGTTVVGVLGFLIAKLLVYSRATHTVGKEKSNYLQFGAAMLVLSIAMLALSGVIKIIGGMPLDQAVVGVIAVMAILVMFEKMMKTGSKLQKTAGSLALIAVIIAELIVALALLSTIPADQILPAAEAMAMTLIAFTVMLRFMPSASSWSDFAKRAGAATVALIVFAGIGTVLSLFAQYNSNITPKKMLAFATALTEMLLGFAAIVTVLGKIKINSFKEFLKTLAAFAIVIAGFIGLISLVSYMVYAIPNAKDAVDKGIEVLASMWQLWPVLLTMSALTAAFIGIAALYSKLRIKSDDFASVVIAFTAISLIVSGLSMFVGGMNTVSPGVIETGIGILASMWQLAPVLLEFATLTAILVAVAAMYNALRVDAMSFASVAVGFTALMLLIVGLAWLVEQFTQNDGSNVVVRGILTLSYMSKLGPALLEMSGVMAVITFLGMLLAGPQLGLALVAVLGLEVLFGALIGIIGLVALFLGAITQGGGLEKVLRGLEMMVKIATATGDAIGGFVGGILGGIVGGLASALPTAANMFNWFIDIMAPAVEKMNNLHIDQSAVDSMRNLVETMLLFSAAGFVDSIPIIGEIFSNTSLANAAEQLAGMIDAMISVDQKLSEYNKNTTDHAVFDQDLTERLRGFASMFKEIQAVVPRTGGWAQKILGEQDMATFGTRIVKFIMAAKLADITLRRYIDSVGDAAWNKDTTERVINVGTMFANLEKAIPAQDGVLQGFLGSSSLDTFGQRIVTFIDAMVSFDTAIRLYEEEHGGFKKSRAAAVVTIGTMLSNLEKALPEQKGAFLAFFSTNKQSLADFASGLGPLGEGIASFAVALNDSEGGDILGDAQKMKDAAEALKVIVDAWSGIAGETNGTTVDKIANGELAVFDKWGVALSLVQDLLTPAENGETKINAVKHMAEGLVQFAQAIAPFFDATAGMDFTRLTAFGQAFADIAMAFNLAGSMDENAANTLKAGAVSVAQMQVNSFIEELYAQKKRVNDTSKEVFVDTLAEMINAPDSIEKQHSIGYTMAENVQAGAKMRFDKPTALTQEDVENMFAGGAGPEQSYQMARQYGENLADATFAGYSENVELAAPASAMPGMDLTSMFQYIPGIGGSGGFEIGNIIGNDMFDGLKGILSGSVGDTGGVTSLLSGVFNPNSNADLLEGLTGDGGDIADALTGGTLSFLGDSGNYEDIYSVLGDSFGSFGTGTDLTELGNLMNADGSEAMLAYFGGMPEAVDSEEAQKSLSGTFDELTKAMKGNIDEKMPATGKYAVDGFIKGINHPDSLKKLRTAGESMGTTFDRALNGRLKIESPSKVMEQSGQYTVVGFVKGVLESMYMAKDAADELGVSTVDAMSAAVSYAYAAAISDYDFTPTISPVLDLSEVRAGASGLSGLFDLSPQIKMASDNNRMVNEYVSRVQADNAAAFAALNSLQDNMSKVGVRLEDGWQPDLEGAIERGFSNVSVNLDGKKVGKMNVDYQNRQNFLRGKTQVK